MTHFCTPFPKEEKKKVVFVTKKKESKAETVLSWTIAGLLMFLMFVVTPLYIFKVYTDQVWKLVTSDGRVYIQAPPENKSQKDYDYFTMSNPKFKILEKKVTATKAKGYTYFPPKKFIRN